MTEDQKEAREERLSIMTLEGVSEEEAEKYCDSKVAEYGIREQKQQQDELF